MTLPVLILHHLVAVALGVLAALLAVFSYALGAQGGRTLNGRRARPGTTGVLIELDYIAELPIACLLDAGDAVFVADWLEQVKEGVGIRA